MKLFYHIARTAFQRHLTYRVALLAGLVTNLAFGILRAMVMTALFAGRPSMNGMDLQQAITYTGLTQSIIAYLMFFGWWDLMNSVYSGDIAVALLQPVHFFGYWLAQDLGRALVHIALRGLPIIAVYAYLYHITFPASILQWIGLCAALLLSLLVSFAWRFLVNLMSFWTPDARGLGRFFFGLSYFFSGFFMPLRFFPDWFQRAAAFTPFPATINTVIEIFLNLRTGPEMLTALIQQLLWFAGLVAIGQWVLQRGIRSLVVQGG